MGVQAACSLQKLDLYLASENTVIMGPINTSGLVVVHIYMHALVGSLDKADVGEVMREKAKDLTIWESAEGCVFRSRENAVCISQIPLWTTCERSGTMCWLMVWCPDKKVKRLWHGATEALN